MAWLPFCFLGKDKARVKRFTGLMGSTSRQIIQVATACTESTGVLNCFLWILVFFFSGIDPLIFFYFLTNFFKDEAHHYAALLKNISYP